MPVLEARDVEKVFPGVMALGGVTLNIEQGEVRGLIGPNGAGKSTLISTIMGLYRPDSGSIWFRGEDISRMPIWDRVKRGLNATHQTALYVPELSIRRHIELGIMVNGFPATDVMLIAEIVGLEGEMDENPDVLSALGAKKLEIAKALSTRPSFIMLDECFAGLSFEEGMEIIEIIRTIAEERHLTVLVVDHNLALVERVAHVTTVIDRGVVIAEGTFEELFSNQDVVDAYMG